MKEKYIPRNMLTKKQFFLLMVVPLLMGLIITLTSIAQADWNRGDDPCLLHSPQKQGWILMGERDPFSNLLKSPDETLKTAAR
jgi:hypothetical protein